MTAAAWLYAVVGAAALCVLCGWHINKLEAYNEFTLLDLICEGGKISLAKFNEFGSFLISSLAVVICVIKGADALSTAALIGAYATIFALRRVAGQAVHANASTKVRTAEIQSEAAAGAVLDLELTDTRETDDELPPGKPVAKKRRMLS